MDQSVNYSPPHAQDKPVLWCQRPRTASVCVQPAPAYNQCPYSQRPHPNPSTWRAETRGSGCSLTSWPSQPVSSRFSEKLCLKNQGGELLRKTPSVNLYLTCVLAHTHVCTHTHTNKHTHTQNCMNKLFYILKFRILKWVSLGYSGNVGRAASLLEALKEKLSPWL